MRFDISGCGKNKNMSGRSQQKARGSNLISDCLGCCNHKKVMFKKTISELLIMLTGIQMLLLSSYTF